MNRTYPILKTKYTTSPVTLNQAREWLRLDIEGVTVFDSLIGDLLKAAIDYVETECNLSLGISDYEWYTDGRPCEIRDTFYVKEITAVQRFVDTTYTDLAVETYTLIPISKRRSEILWGADETSGSCRYLVKFKAGLSPEELPPRLLLGVRALVGAWYENPGDNVSEKKTLSDKILAPYVIGYAG